MWIINRAFLINKNYFACFTSSVKIFCFILLLIIEDIGIESASIANFNTRDDISFSSKYHLLISKMVSVIHSGCLNIFTFFLLHFNIDVRCAGIIQGFNFYYTRRK